MCWAATSQSGAAKPGSGQAEQDAAPGPTDIGLPVPPELGNVSKVSLRLCDVVSRVTALEGSSRSARPSSHAHAARQGPGERGIRSLQVW